jgi:hypothetical protein
MIKPSFMLCYLFHSGKVNDAQKSASITADYYCCKSKNKKVDYWRTHLRRAPPGRLGSSLMRLPAMSHLFNDLSAASAALTS